MPDIKPFSGRVLDAFNTYHGEGPTYDPATDTAWWFSIGNRELHELNLSTGKKAKHDLPFMASVLARIDAERQIIASEHGLHIRTIGTGALELVTPIENGVEHMRSNDGRCHPSGALWFGTMTKSGGDHRRGAGTIYHVLHGKVTPIVPAISIPNGIWAENMGLLDDLWVDPLDIKDGFITAPKRPGHGLRFKDQVRKDFVVQ